MKSYEAVWEIFNQCPNNQMRDVFFEELEIEDPEKYIQEKFKDKEFTYDKNRPGRRHDYLRYCDFRNQAEVQFYRMLEERSDAYRAYISRKAQACAGRRHSH